MATFAVTKEFFDNKRCTIGTVTWDGSATYFETGLSHVDFVVLTSNSGDIAVNAYYPNYSDNGSTAKEGAVGFASAPTDAHIYRYFAVGRG